MLIYIILIFFVLMIVFVVKMQKSPHKDEGANHRVVSRSGMTKAKYSGKMFSLSSQDVESSDSLACGEEMESNFLENDFLGKAAEAGHKAKDAVKAKKYDEAWGLYHKQKELYMKHANRSGFTPMQVLALDASVHENLANILRLEGKHKDALANIVYWVIAGSERPIKRHKQKLQAYFNRCDFKNTSLEDAEKTLATISELPQYTLARSIVSGWVTSG